MSYKHVQLRLAITFQYTVENKVKPVSCHLPVTLFYCFQRNINSVLYHVFDAATDKNQHLLLNSLTAQPAPDIFTK